jgi:hypothetical protein
MVISIGHLFHYFEYQCVTKVNDSSRKPSILIMNNNTLLLRVSSALADFLLIGESEKHARCYSIRPSSFV